MAKSKAANSKEPKRAPEKSNITDDLLDAMQQSVHDMCSALGEVCTKPKSTVALLDELGNHLAETEAAGTLILNFLQPVGKLAKGGCPPSRPERPSGLHHQPRAGFEGNFELIRAHFGHSVRTRFLLSSSRVLKLWLPATAIFR
jgi:hypothetical protein